MANAAAPVSSRDSQLGGLSLILFALGAVGPFLNPLAVPIIRPGQPFTGADPAVQVIGLWIAFSLLALIFGFFGRRSRAGRLGFIGSGVVLGVVLFLALFLVSRPAVKALPPPAGPSLPAP